MNVYRLEPDYDKRGNSPWDWLSYGGEFDDLDDLLKQASSPKLGGTSRLPGA